MSFGRFRPCLAAALLAVLPGLPKAAMAQAGGPPTGRLSCTVGAALGPVVKSHKSMECRFRPRRGPAQHYTGIVHGFGLDLGPIRNPSMAWRVYGPYARAPLGVLNGRYKSTAAVPGATTAAGHALVGGTDNGVTLRPLPFQSNRGVNAAVGVNSLELTLIPPGRRR